MALVDTIMGSTLSDSMREKLVVVLHKSLCSARCSFNNGIFILMMIFLFFFSQHKK